MIQVRFQQGSEGVQGYQNSLHFKFFPIIRYSKLYGISIIKRLLVEINIVCSLLFSQRDSSNQSNLFSKCRSENPRTQVRTPFPMAAIFNILRHNFLFAQKECSNQKNLFCESLSERPISQVLTPFQKPHGGHFFIFEASLSLLIGEVLRSKNSFFDSR